MLGIVTFVVLFLVLRIGRMKTAQKAGLLAALTVIALLNIDKINVERYETITNLENDYNLEEGGRWDTWKKGLIILMGRPLTGVGVNNFGMAIGNYRRDEGVLPKWQAAHSSVVQVVVEVGVIGGTLWILLVVGTAMTFWRLRRWTARPGLEYLPTVGGVLFVGFIAQLVSSSFLSMGYSVFFTVFFALSVSLKQIMATPAAAARMPAPGRAARRTLPATRLA
jgi:O-antigen ligase